MCNLFRIYIKWIQKNTLLGINYRFVKRVNCVILLNINYFGMKRMHIENKWAYVRLFLSLLVGAFVVSWYRPNLSYSYGKTMKITKRPCFSARTHVRIQMMMSMVVERDEVHANNKLSEMCQFLSNQHMNKPCKLSYEIRLYI